jgi:hypothetical protein
MNRLCARALTTTALAALAGFVFPACAHDDASLFIRHVMAPPTTQAAGGGCIYQSDPAQPYINQGKVDAAIASSYSPVVLVANQLTSRGSTEDVRAETSRVTIQGAIVRVVDPVDGSVQMDNTVLAAATLDPGTGTTPSYAAIGITMMNSVALAHFDPGTKGAPSRLAVAYVKVFGQTLGGQSLESNEFQFPISVCHGCLVVIPADAFLNSWCSQSHPASSTVVSPCQIGQDQAIDCSLCQPNPACIATPPP